jgi:hypothetical protein
VLCGLVVGSCSHGQDPRPIQVSDSPAGAFEAALAPMGDHLAVAWYDTRDGNGEIYVRLLDRNGRPAGPERRLTVDAEESYEPSLDPLGHGLVVAWYDKKPDGTLTARLGAWSLDGSPRWALVLGSPARNPVVRASEGSIFCAWIQGAPGGTEAVWTGWWTPAGVPRVVPRPIAVASRTTWNLNAVLDGSDVAWVTFDAVAGTRANELVLARVDAVGVSSVARLTTDDGFASKYPDVAVHDGRAAIAWYDLRDGNPEVYLAALPTDDLLSTGQLEARARRVTTTPGESIGAYVAWSGNRIGLAWSDATEGQHEIYWQMFDASNRPIGEPRRVTRTLTSSLIPAIRPWRAGFALAWNEYDHAAGGRSQIALYLAGQ